MTEPLHLSKEQKAAVEAEFKERVVATKLKAGTKTYKNAELEFFVGAMTALKTVANYEYPADWVLKLMSGRSITGK
jgi:hypothetical protein